jgi:hypothetical protein
MNGQGMTVQRDGLNGFPEAITAIGTLSRICRIKLLLLLSVIPFTQQNSFSTLDGFGTNGDFNLFQDTDGSAYLIRSGSTNNGILIISKLNRDYTNSDGVNHVNYTNDATSPFGQKSEGHTMFKRGSTYFWMASGNTIRTPNANMYVTSSGRLRPGQLPPIPSSLIAIPRAPVLSTILPATPTTPKTIWRSRYLVEPMDGSISGTGTTFRIRHLPSVPDV